ncbi:hypothetical protein GOP47_0002280 [Adiantum capillus-veneris]|uniref:Uncharacterized protein n=1 Tax=Adiantum capillus-veneris TaxID=13818 RepID=A0A9D4ZR37_ADICA|nr:hypothetical protein GOP47_0002280 [Adiantum capillus-veneris]
MCFCVSGEVFFTEDYTMEGSLADDRVAAYGTGASSDREHSYGWQKDLWRQGDEAPCYAELKGSWRVCWPTSAKEDLKMHVLHVMATAIALFFIQVEPTL